MVGFVVTRVHILFIKYRCGGMLSAWPNQNCIDSSSKLVLWKWGHSFKEHENFKRIIMSKETHFKSIPTNFTQKMILILYVNELRRKFDIFLSKFIKNYR